MSVYLHTICNGTFTKALYSEQKSCEEQGEAASDQCYGRDQNPYPSHTVENRWWDWGWSISLMNLCGDKSRKP